MGIYSEYLDRKFNFVELTAERKKQLKEISRLRGGRDILVYAADLNSPQSPIRIDYTDLLPFKDQLEVLKGDALDLIIETPGGSGEVAEDIVELIRDKYDDFAVIVPGWAKSAGTLIVMASNEILMDHSSAVGPIDAQISWQGKWFSADALIEGFEKIKEEVDQTGKLNRAYIPILQGISPGELQSAQNALDFAKKLVTEWLAKYKFQNWTIHSSTKKTVTSKDKEKRAEEIAKRLCDHRSWKTHGRSIKLEDLERMKLLITDYSKNRNLNEAIRRYHTLLQMTLATNIYKIFETPNSQIYRFSVIERAPGRPEDCDLVELEVSCKKCGNNIPIQANFKNNLPIKKGYIPFPKNDNIKCEKCGNEIALSDLRREIEAETKKRII